MTTNDYDKTAEAILRAMVAAMEDAPPPATPTAVAVEPVHVRLGQPGTLRARMRKRARLRQEAPPEDEGEDGGGSTLRPRPKRRT